MATIEKNAQSLQLRLARRSGNTSAASLKLTLAEVTDDSNQTITVTASTLALPLAKQERPAASALSLTLNRKHLQLGVSTPKKKRTMQGVAAFYDSATRSADTIDSCYSLVPKRADVAYDIQVQRAKLNTIVNCSAVLSKAFAHIEKRQHADIDELIGLYQCYRSQQEAFQHIHNSFNQDITDTVSYQKTLAGIALAIVQLENCTQVNSTETIGFTRCLNAFYAGKSLSQSFNAQVTASLPVPCRYFPIPEPPPTPQARQCRIRPPSRKLALKLGRRSQYRANNLPLPLTCWHDEPTLPMPNKDTYMIFTEFTATIGGISIEPLSFNIKTDMSSYCWSGNVSISPDDYERIKHKLDVEVGSEPILSVMINTHRFSIIAEESGRSRSFANHTHNISGRSITARLGADYAKPNDKLFDQNNYAVQIVNQQLNGLSVTLDEFSIKDWLIPANTYSVSNKTPIAVIAEIADAAGGFVVSHDYDAKLSIKKRWKVNAWDLATTTPDLILPADVIKKADDKPTKNTRYNVVELMGNTEGFGVYRQAEGRDIPAPMQSSALFTSQDVTIPKGASILSDSGKHNIYQLKLPWSDEIQLAELGQILQLNDLDGVWRGVVTAVAISVEKIDDAPAPYQTVTVDRYIDV